MNNVKKLLWIDGLGGLAVGLIMLVFKGILADFYALDEIILIYMGIINILYGSYSTSLAFREERPKMMILILVAANFSWLLICLFLAFYFIDSASIFGVLHFIVEGLYVGALAFFEWRWREFLLKK